MKYMVESSGVKTQLKLRFIDQVRQQCHQVKIVTIFKFLYSALCAKNAYNADSDKCHGRIVTNVTIYSASYAL